MQRLGFGGGQIFLVHNFTVLRFLLDDLTHFEFYVARFQFRAAQIRYFLITLLLSVDLSRLQI